MRYRGRRIGFWTTGAVIWMYILFIWPFRFICWIVRKIRDRRYNVDFDDYPDDNEWIDDSDNEQQIQSEINKYSDLPEMPEMQQVFTLGNEMYLGVQFVSRCPDETAHIRILGDTTFSELYKRRVYRDGDDRYFKLNNKKYYLDNKRTTPVGPTQARPGK